MARGKKSEHFKVVKPPNKGSARANFPDSLGSRTLTIYWLRDNSIAK